MSRRIPEVDTYFNRLLRFLQTALKRYKAAMEFEHQFAGAHFWANRVYEELEDFPNSVRECDRLFGHYRGSQFYKELLENFKRSGANGSQAVGESPLDLTPDKRMKPIAPSRRFVDIASIGLVTGCWICAGIARIQGSRKWPGRTGDLKISASPPE